jgi:hypothetical protein
MNDGEDDGRRGGGRRGEPMGEGEGGEGGGGGGGEEEEKGGSHRSSGHERENPSTYEAVVSGDLTGDIFPIHSPPERSRQAMHGVRRARLLGANQRVWCVPCEKLDSC